MKKEYTDSTASSAASTSDDVTVNFQVVADIVTSTAGPKREATSDRDRDSNKDSNSDGNNAPPSDDDCDDDCDEECYYGTLENEPSQSQQHHQHQHQLQQLQQEQEQPYHPYMSLYEPLLLATEPIEVQDRLPSASASASQQEQQQRQRQPDATYSSHAVAKQSPLVSSRINTTTTTTSATTFDRAKKRRRITTAAAVAATAATKIDYSENSNMVAEDDVHCEVVREKDTRTNLNNEQVVDTRVKTTLFDDDKGFDNVVDEEDDDDDDASFESSDDEAIIERMKKLATKKSKIINSKPQSANNVVTATDRIIVDESNENYTGSSKNNVPTRKIYTYERDTIWEEMYQRLVAYKKEHNDTTVPRTYEKDPQLGQWVRTQRTMHTNQKMTEERKLLLDSIGFAWVALATWEEMYQRLVAYKTEHKDTTVPNEYKKDPQLGQWVRTQRRTYKNKKIAEKRKCLLNSIGFVWVALLKGTVRNSATWEEMYQRLVAYKTEHKNTIVPRSYKKDPQLGRWVNNQRRTYKNKKMTEERKCLLNSFGFVWVALSSGTSTAKWEEMYQRLVAYKTEHKDTNVPQSYKKDPQLGTWINTQRKTYRYKKMTEERRCLLNSIGFVWNTLSSGNVHTSAKWEEMY